jgi:hypothetical protein
MTFVMTYEIRAEHWDKAVERFLATGGPAPAGVKLVGRWHAAAGSRGFLLLESDDVTAVYRFGAEWHDVCTLAVTPVVTDEEAATVLKSMKK